MADPYLLPNGVLRNKLDITDPDELAEAETRATGARLIDLESTGIEGPFTFDTLRYIHWCLFQDVYEWAGEPRTISLERKPYEDAQSIRFVEPHLIQKEAARIFTGLHRVGNFIGMRPPVFARYAADFFVEINQLHPFREGNGRAQRMLLREIAVEAGHNLAFDVVTQERMAHVSIEGCLGDTEPARRLFAEIIDPSRAAILRKAVRLLKRDLPNAWRNQYLATTVAGQRYAGRVVATSPTDFLMRVSRDPQDWLAAGLCEDLPEGAKPGDEIDITARRWK